MGVGTLREAMVSQKLQDMLDPILTVKSAICLVGFDANQQVDDNPLTPKTVDMVRERVGEDVAAWVDNMLRLMESPEGGLTWGEECQNIFRYLGQTPVAQAAGGNKVEHQAPLDALMPNHARLAVATNIGPFCDTRTVKDKASPSYIAVRQWFAPLTSLDALRQQQQ